MELDDLDWERGELMVRGKSLRHDRLPIPKDVGEALAAYLCHGDLAVRRAGYFSASTHRGKGLPLLSPSVISSDGPSSAPGSIRRARGSHLLRHALAVRMLRGGASLAEIGEILRHELPSTTEIYAKVDVAALRALALPWQGGEL